MILVKDNKVSPYQCIQKCQIYLQEVFFRIVASYDINFFVSLKVNPLIVIIQGL